MKLNNTILHIIDRIITLTTYKISQDTSEVKEYHQANKGFHQEKIVYQVVVFHLATVNTDKELWLVVFHQEILKLNSITGNYMYIMRLFTMLANNFKSEKFNIKSTENKAMNKKSDN